MGMYVINIIGVIFLGWSRWMGWVCGKEEEEERGEFKVISLGNYKNGDFINRN